MLSTFATFAQGIKGKIVDQDGDPMPNASIYIPKTGTGTASNVNGIYELRLNPGQYKITYQFIGYEAQTQTINVGSGFVEKNIQLKPQLMILSTVELSSDAEDPAYTIMRKAISKAKFHLLQINKYSATVYTKGTGQVSEIPWPFRKALEKEGVDTARVFTSESVSEVYFERPNTFKEKIISVRTSGEDDDNASPNSYINTSFYLPTVVDAISPLSPSAFSYYRFEFLGSFVDRGQEVNKIKVTPRSKGDKVFEGTIYIRENIWNIHSLDLKTSFEGFNVYIEKVFAPIIDDIWLPVTQKIAFNGSMLGFGLNYKYIASVSDYQVTPNPDLRLKLVVIDDKIDPVPEEVVEEEKKIEKEQPKEALKEDKALTRKKLAKLMEDYEEEEWDEQEDEGEVVSDYWYLVDTGATKKDSAYWANIRPVPLTESEVKGYKVDDSTYVAEKLDSLEKEDGKAFSGGDIFFGNTYKFGKRARFKFNGFVPEFRFNTVEGFNLDFAGTFRWKEDTTLRLRFEPRVRYGFSSGKVYSKLKTKFGFGKYPQRLKITVDGGKYINQFYENSIDQHINSIWSLLFARNYMKVYEQTFGSVVLERQLGYKWSVGLNLNYASRNSLYNRTDFSFFRPGENWYTSNTPENLNGSIPNISDNRAFTTAVHVNYQPWLKFRRYNGKLIPIDGNSPKFRFSYFSGWKNVFQSTSDFQRIEVGAKSEFSLGVRANVDFDIEGGTFLNNENAQFMDYKHFNGGQTEIAPMSVTGNFRLLPYYIYSTQQSYVSLLTHVRFRKFLFTHIPIVRISGVRENVFLNYLKTNNSPNYWEVGYTIDKIFKAFRLELVYSFNDLEPQTFGVRIGVSSLFFSN